MSSEGSPERRGRGRPRGSDSSDTRERIRRAAAKEFAAHGYENASIRSIARAANVDPALVPRYFEDKAALFTAALDVPVRPDRIVQLALAGPREQVGETIVRSLLEALERGPRDRIVGLIRTALGHEFAATILRQFILREVLGRVAAQLAVPDGELRATLAASQLVGLVVIRYGIRAEPLASASPDEVVRRIGPVVQHHLLGGDLSGGQGV